MILVKNLTFFHILCLEEEEEYKDEFKKKAKLTFLQRG